MGVKKSLKNIRSKGEPRADPSSRYHKTLKKSSTVYPHVTDALMRAERHRPRRWKQFIDPVDLKAVDLLLDFLISISESLAASNETQDLAFLSDRIADDIRMSLDGVLGGYLQITSDAMRDIIETELLIQDFVLNPNQIDIWRNADEDVLRKSFQPVHMRKRQANARGLDIKDVPGATDYAAHSQLLHVGRRSLFARSPESGAMAGHRVITVLDAIGDVMFHGTSAVQTLDSLLHVVNRPGPDPSQALAALASASEDLDEARATVEEMEKRAAESIPAGGNWEAELFESGMIIAFSPDTVAARVYRTDRIDFRTIHRSISGEQGAVFELISLGEMKPLS